MSHSRRPRPATTRIGSGTSAEPSVKGRSLGRHLLFESLENRRLLTASMAVRFEFDTPAAATTLSVGETFDLKVFVQDTRSSPTGVFQAYFNLAYDSTLMHVTGTTPITHGPDYDAGVSGSSTAGMLTDVGGVETNQITQWPPGNEELLFDVTFQADKAGTISLTPSLSSVPTHQPMLYGTPGSVPLSSISFSGESIPATAASPLTLNPSTLPAWTANQAGYNQAITASGGTGTDTFAITTGSLPTGLSINKNTGLVSGTPAVANTFNFTVTATDASGDTGSRAYSVTVNPAITLTPAALPAWTVNRVGYSQTIVASGGTGADTFSVTTGALPTGLVLNSSTGAISGTPTAAGTFSFTVTAKDTVAATGSKAYSVTINPAIAVSPATLPGWTANKAGYSQTIAASGGTGSETFAVTAGSLPAGLALNSSSGVINGTPTAASSFNFTVTATDSIGAMGSRAYSLTINPAIVVGTAGLPNWTANKAGYGQTITTSGGTGAETFSVTAGALPTGLALNGSSGAIAGTPTAASSFNFTVTATDAVGATGSKAFSITINPALNITATTLPPTTTGTAYTAAVSTSGGTGADTFALTAGTLPSGLGLNSSTGVISGTPTTPSTFGFTITATDSVGAMAAQAYSVTVNRGIAIGPASLPSWTTNKTGYSQTISASGGTGAETFSITVGSLPAGLALNSSTGLVSGTPTAAGTFNFTVTATDTVGAVGSKAYSLTINPAVALGPATLPAWTVNEAGYSQTIAASGGTGADAFSITAGALPAGLALNNSTGAIAGTPTAGGTFNFTVTATDAVGATGAKAYTLTINPALAVSPAALPAWTADQAGYSQTIAASGGTGADAFSITAGTLPAGLSLNSSTGVIAGTPTAAGSFNFTVTATDAVGATGAKAYTLAISPALAVSPATLPAWTVNQAGYSQTVTGSGGTGAKTFSVTAGGLPTGLALNGATGAISGTPGAANTFNFTVTATDSIGATAAQAYSLVINPALAITATALPPATTGKLYGATISTSGGTGADTFSVTAGSLPTGLTLNSSTGVISGTSSAVNNFNFTVTATDSVGATASQAYSFSVNSTIALSPATLLAWTANNAGYSQTIVASGGTGAVTFSITAGALPTGLSIDTNTGVISGTPSAANTFNFTVTATDANGASGARAYSIVINPAPSVVATTLPVGTAGTAYTTTVSASGGTGTDSFSITAGALPPDLTLDSSTGVISGTPTTAGTFNVTVTATDAVGATASQAFSIVVNIALGPAALPAWTVNQAGYRQAITTSGSTGAVTFGVSAGALPTGLTLDSNTGFISGTASAAGTFSFTLTAADANGATGSKGFSATIDPTVAIGPAILPAWTLLQPGYLQTITASGGTGTETFSVTAGALPTGLVLDSNTGIISGMPSATGAFNFTITATDMVGATAAQSYLVSVNPALTVSPTTLPDSTANEAGYNHTISASGGTGADTFTITQGALPGGLTLDSSTGAISGTPTEAGMFDFTVTAVDSVGATVAQGYLVTINPAIVLGPATLPAWTVEQGGYNQTIVSNGGTGTTTFSITAGALPDGLMLDSMTGVISGEPITADTFNFTVTATDTAGATGSKAYSLLVNPMLFITPTTLPTATVGTAFTTTVSTTGGTGADTFSIGAGALPAGLALDSNTGIISGTPTAAGTFAFTVDASDSVGTIATEGFPLIVNLALGPASLPNWTANKAGYSQTITASGGTGAETFSVTAGNLPTGLSLDGDSGAISGRPTAAGNFNFTIGAANTDGATGSKAYSVIISPAVSIGPVTLPDWTANHAGYSQTISASGGTGAETFSLTAGALPTGLALDMNSGLVSGTPSAAGNFNFTITAADTVGATASQAYSVTINPALSVSPTSLLNWTANQTGYNQTIVASGGTGTDLFSVTAGTLPTGLALDANSGLVSGTPSAAGTFGFTVTATDAVGAVASRAYSIAVNPAVGVNPATLPSWTINRAGYSQTLTATGGTGGESFSITAGALPTGLALNGRTGLISGTPSAAGMFGFTVTATDSLGASGSRSYSVAINPGIAIAAATLPNWTANHAGYDQAIAASGGTGADTFSIAAGALPAGLTLKSDTGVISGTPTGTGAFSFSIAATDSVGSTASRAFSLTVNPAITIGPASLPGSVVNQAGYVQTITAAGGTLGHTFSVTAGALPTGLVLNGTTGVISGTPSVANTFNFTITAADTVGATASQSYSLAVTGLTLSGTAYQDADKNGAFDSADTLLAGTTINLNGTTSTGSPVNLTTQTASDGTYHFTNLAAGVYDVKASLPAYLVAGSATVGNLGGTLHGEEVSNITLAASNNATGYNFAAVGLAKSSTSINLFLASTPPANQLYNPAPTISGLANQSVSAGTSSVATSFTIHEPWLPNSSWTVSGVSSNTTLVPNGNIVYGGSGAQRTITVKLAANQTGTTTITTTVTDPYGHKTSASYLLTVVAAAAQSAAVVPAALAAGAAQSASGKGTVAAPFSIASFSASSSVRTPTVPRAPAASVAAVDQALASKQSWFD
jgi:hypothetical protein